MSTSQMVDWVVSKVEEYGIEWKNEDFVERELLKRVRSDFPSNWRRTAVFIEGNHHLSGIRERISEANDTYVQTKLDEVNGVSGLPVNVSIDRGYEPESVSAIENAISAKEADLRSVGVVDSRRQELESRIGEAEERVRFYESILEAREAERERAISGGRLKSAERLLDVIDLARSQLSESRGSVVDLRDELGRLR